MLIYSAATWAALQAHSTQQARAQTIADLFASGATIEFRDASNALIRSITTAAWTVGVVDGQYVAIPGEFTDAASGSGTPAVAIVKAGSTEIMRCTCGTSAESWYRLLANLVDGVPIRRGALVFPVPAPVAAGTHQPAVITAPAVNGQAKVGATLTSTPGTYSGNPVPTLTRRWMRGSTAIAGATYTTYQLQLADLGAIVRYEEVATNSAGSAVGASNSVGPIAAAILSIDPPATIDIAQGGTYALAQHVSGGVPPYGEYAVDTGSLPANVSLNPSTGVLSASAAASVGTTTGLKFKVDDAYVAPSLPLFKVLSAAGGSDLPFTFGHVFGKSEIPAGSFLNSDLADWQANPTTYWPDGSLRHAIISGRATCTAGVQKSVALSVSGSDRTGAALTESNLASALPAVTLECGAGGESISLNALVGTSARHRTVCAGPVMANFIYRKQLSGSQHLVAWFDVRLYKGGAIEIFPWVENCYLTVAGPSNDVRTWTLSIGGSAKFSQSIDIKHHTRIPLLSGKSYSYWTVPDPQITPGHDVAHLRSTRMVPNYAWGSPSSGHLDNLGARAYTPNTTSIVPSQMGTAGGSGHILHNPDATYAAGGSAQAWNAAMVFGLSGGSWSVHYRAEASSTQGTAGFGNEPFMFSQYPNASLQVQDTPTIPVGTGPTNGAPVISHQPSFGYLPWLLSARWWFLDEMLFWSGWNYLYNSVTHRKGGGANGADGVMKTYAGANTDRGAAWALRTIAQGLVSLPATHPSFASMKNSWEANMAFYHAMVIDGTVAGSLSGASAKNDLGIFSFYTGDFGASIYDYAANSNAEMYGSAFMQTMIQQMLGFAWDLDLPQSAPSKTAHETLRDFGYRVITMLSGDGSGNSWSYRNFAISHLNWGKVGGTYYTSWAGAHALYVSGYGITKVNDGRNTLFDTPLQYGSNVDRDMTTGTTGATRLGQHLVTLSYAVDHGFPGASDGFGRVSGANNFWPVANGEFPDTAEIGVLPR